MSVGRRAALIAVIAAVVVLVWLAARGGGGGHSGEGADERRWVTLTSEHMATVVWVTVPDDDRAEEAGQIVSETFAEVDRQMSEWKPGSPLTALNESAGIGPVELPRGLIGVIETGLEISEATGGAFDVTWAALWGLWDFNAEEPGVPDAGQIAERVALVDWRRVEIDRGAGTVYLPEAGMMVGLGGIAKGFALDLAADRLREAGIFDFLIVSGGQVYAGGERDGRPWRVGVRDPRGEQGEYLLVLELRDLSVSTSGDYERYFEVEGERYHHVLDPRTGWPSRGTRSATVVSDRGILADGLSTGAMVAGSAGAGELAERFGVWVFLVDDEGRVSEFGRELPGMMLGDRREP